MPGQTALTSQAETRQHGQTKAQKPNSIFITLPVLPHPIHSATINPGREALDSERTTQLRQSSAMRDETKRGAVTTRDAKNQNKSTPPRANAIAFVYASRQPRTPLILLHPCCRDRIPRVSPSGHDPNRPRRHAQVVCQADPRRIQPFHVARLQVAVQRRCRKWHVIAFQSKSFGTRVHMSGVSRQHQNDNRRDKKRAPEWSTARREDD